MNDQNGAFGGYGPAVFGAAAATAFVAQQNSQANRKTMLVGAYMSRGMDFTSASRAASHDLELQAARDEIAVMRGFGWRMPFYLVLWALPMSFFAYVAFSPMDESDPTSLAMSDGLLGAAVWALLISLPFVLILRRWGRCRRALAHWRGRPHCDWCNQQIA